MAVTRSTRNRVTGDELVRGFESHPLRHLKTPRHPMKSWGSIRVDGCFISKTRWKYSFFSSFPLVRIHKAFCRLFLWNFKKKSINHFLGHSQFWKPLISIIEGFFVPDAIWKTFFYRVIRDPFYHILIFQFRLFFDTNISTAFSKIILYCNLCVLIQC